MIKKTNQNEAMRYKRVGSILLFLSVVSTIFSVAVFSLSYMCAIEVPSYIKPSSILHFSILLPLVPIILISLRDRYIGRPKNFIWTLLLVLSVFGGLFLVASLEMFNSYHFSLSVQQLLISVGIAILPYFLLVRKVKNMVMLLLIYLLLGTAVLFSPRFSENKAKSYNSCNEKLHDRYERPNPTINF